MTDFNIYSPGDTFDSRDVMERFEELDAEATTLQDAIDNAAEALEEANGEVADAERGEGSMVDMSAAVAAVAAAELSLKEAERALEEWTDYEEWEAIKSFKEDAEDYGDWDHGETFIADSYFEDYARELAEDIGAIKRDMEWPCNCIDWEAAAEQLKADYTSYELPGIGGNKVTYWARS